MQMKDPRRFIYRLDSEDRIVFVNDDWIDFAIENGLAGLTRENVVGKSLWELIGDRSIQQLYKTFFARLRIVEKTRRIPYRCDSPDCRRFMEMEIFSNGTGELELVNRIVKLEPRDTVDLLDQTAKRNQAFLGICSVCKKIRLRENQWYEIEDALAILGLARNGEPYPQLSHSLCNRCLDDWNGKLKLLEMDQ